MLLELTASNSRLEFTRKIVVNQKGGTIGRSESCDLMLPCDEKIVSRVHASITNDNHKFYIRDDSSNGVFVNTIDKPLGSGNSIILADRDTINIGSFTIQVKLISPINNPVTPETVTHKKTPTIVAKTNNRQTLPDSSKKPLGYSTDHFTPPKVFIPEDWSLNKTQVPSEKKDTKPKPVEDKPDTLAFSNQQLRLVSSLLKGMKMDQYLHADQMTPEIMAVIGSTLRLAIDGILRNHESLQNHKSLLSLDDKAIKSTAENDPMSQYPHVESLLKVLLNPHHSERTAIPLMISNGSKAFREDQEVLFQGFKEALNILSEGLSPQVVSQSFENQPPPDRRLPNSIKALGNQFSKDAKKWIFYEQNCSKLTNKLKEEVFKNFEKKILQLTVRRSKK